MAVFRFLAFRPAEGAPLTGADIDEELACLAAFDRFPVTENRVRMTTAEPAETALIGGIGFKTLIGHGGKDTITGFGGADLPDGCLGNDRIFGGAGADFLAVARSQATGG